MKKTFLFIVIVAGLIGAGVFYLHRSKATVDIFSKTINAITQNQNNNTQPADQPVAFKNYGPAPEFAGITKWLNGDPQTMTSLKGKVVIVDFWTYSSINSTRTIPYLTKWQNDYKDNGLQVIGVHTPQYAFEKITDNVQTAVKAQGINYPIALDNDYKMWTAYHNQFWPALYIIDKDGNIVYTYYGEGNYADIEKTLRTVLGLEGNYTSPPPVEQNQSQTPQIYLGLAKQTQLGNTEKPSSDAQIYSYPKKLGDNKFAIEGQWAFDQEGAIHTNGFARMKVNFDAAKVSLVADSKTPTTIRVFVDGELVKGVVVNDNQVYELYNSLAGGKHTLEIEIPDGGFEAYTFTFE